MLNAWKIGVYFSAVCVLLATACKKVDDTLPPPKPVEPTLKWETFIIPKGEHYCLNNTLKQASDSSLSFELAFDSSALYTSVLPENQFDWNKVLGFSDCGDLHQTNSLRLVWRHAIGVGIELAAYTYKNGVRDFEVLDTVAVGDTVAVELLKQQSGHYQTRIGSKVFIETRECTTLTSTDYLLYPYFGGDETAPDTVRVHILFKK